MKRWNWWLAYRVLRGRIHVVRYTVGGMDRETLSVELDVDADVRKRAKRLSPGR